MRPACAAGAVAASSAWNPAVPSAGGSTSYWIVASPIVPFFDVSVAASGPTGPTTCVACGSFWSAATLSAMADWFAGVARVPERAWNTTVALVPDCCAKRLVRRSAAVCDSALGILKLSNVRPPLAVASTTMTIAATIHSRIT